MKRRRVFLGGGVREEWGVKGRYEGVLIMDFTKEFIRKSVRIVAIFLI